MAYEAVEPDNLSWDTKKGVSAFGNFINELTGAGAQMRFADAQVKAQQEYDQMLTKQQWEREDTAMSRAVQDYKNAGLNPLLAVGGKGFASSAPVSQNYGSMAMQGMADSMATRAGGFQKLTGFLQNAVNTAMSLNQMRYSIEAANKDIEYKNALIEKLNGESQLNNQEWLFRFARNPLLLQGLGLRNSDLSNAVNIGQYNLDFMRNTHQTRIDLFNDQLSDSESLLWDQIGDTVRTLISVGGNIAGRRLGRHNYTNIFY